MPNKRIDLRPVDRVEITVLVDNYSDTLLMENQGIVHRPDVLPRGPIAEHGLALLVNVAGDGEEHTILMDTGLSPGAMLHNADLLGVDLAKAEALVISHGHWDHLGGLEAFLGLHGPGLPVVAHPDAFNPKRLSLDGGARTVDLPGLRREALDQAGAVVEMRAQPSGMAESMVAVLAEVPRRTPFEKGFPAAQAFMAGGWRPDPLRDDQGLAVLVRGRGLVVISGCAHAGIINTAHHARAVTGVDQVHAVLGGFHLTGSFYKPCLGPTVAAMKEIGPDWLAPMHCTGWHSCQEFARAMPTAYLVSTVGTTFSFQGK